MDLTKITTPFGLLDPDTQEALKGHGGPYELYCPAGWSNYFGQPQWHTNKVCRVKPQPRKPREFVAFLYDDGKSVLVEAPGNGEVAWSWRSIAPCRETIRVREVLKE